MDKIKEAILEWRKRIEEIIQDLNNESQGILSKLINDLNDIKENHFFGDEITTPLTNMFISIIPIARPKLTDSKKIKAILDRAIYDYKSCMNTHFEKLKCQDSFDLVNRLLEDLRKVNETQYRALVKDFEELKQRLRKYESLADFERNFLFILVGILTGFASFITLGLVEDSFKEKCKEIIRKIDDFKSEQSIKLHERSSEISSHFEKILKRTENILNDDFKIKKVVWFDSNVRNSENSRYETQIRNKLAPKLIDLSTFDDKAKLVAFVNGLSSRTLLITSGSSHKDVFGSCYNSTSITDVILFAFNVDLYKDVKQSYDKVYRVVNSFDSLLESIEDVLNDNTFNWVLPLDRINKSLVKFNNDYAYLNFKQIPKDIKYYSSIIEKAAELKLSNTAEARKEVEEFLKVVNNSNDKKVAESIIYMYTCESIYYKLVNQVLKDLNEENILKCEIWIKALNLALKTVNRGGNVTRIKLFRSIDCPGINVRETYKDHMGICFPAFTSTTAREDVAKSFRNGFNNILFEITYDFSKTHSIPPVKISQYSKFKSEEEHLFSIFSMFFIKKIEKIDERNFKIYLEN